MVSWKANAAGAIARTPNPSRKKTMTDFSPSTGAAGQERHRELARQDWTSARFVDEGITIQHVYGTRPAAAFLKSRMIDIDVALRVLLNPARRRNYQLQ